MQTPSDNSQEPEDNKLRLRSIKAVIMDQLMKDMHVLNEQRETEMQTYRTRCQEQDMLISNIKKALNMDKLQLEFDIYRQDTGKKLKASEEALAQAQVTLTILQKDKQAAEEMCKQLKKTIEQLSKEKKTSEEKANKEIEVLKKELSTAKTSRNQLEEMLGKLERKPSISLDRTPLNLKFPGTPTATIDLVTNSKVIGGPSGNGLCSKVTCMPISASPSPKRRKS